MDYSPFRFGKRNDAWEMLAGRIGPRVADPISAARIEVVQPSYLIPVWPFDHEIHCALAATGKFLGLDLELIATPSPDEELGAHLPGRNGLWLITRALCSENFVRKVANGPQQSIVAPR